VKQRSAYLKWADENPGKTADFVLASASLEASKKDIEKYSRKKALAEAGEVEKRPESEFYEEFRGLSTLIRNVSFGSLLTSSIIDDSEQSEEIKRQWEEERKEAERQREKSRLAIELEVAIKSAQEMLALNRSAKKNAEANLEALRHYHYLDWRLHKYSEDRMTTCLADRMYILTGCNEGWRHIDPPISGNIENIQTWLHGTSIYIRMTHNPRLGYTLSYVTIEGETMSITRGSVTLEFALFWALLTYIDMNWLALLEYAKDNHW